MASKNNKKKKNEAAKTGPTGFATDRRKISKVSRVMALLLGIIMIVFMLLSSSVYLFNELKVPRGTGTCGGLLRRGKHLADKPARCFLYKENPALDAGFR